MQNLDNLVLKTEGFDWDKWNIEKNLIKHKVTSQECEEVFLNRPFLKSIPITGGRREWRAYAFGITDRNRKITIVFTIRDTKIRVISARDMSKKERRIYDEKLKKIAKI